MLVMSIGTLARGRRRIAVEFAPALAARIDEEVAARSSRLGGATASDVIREAVAAFLLPSDASNSSQSEEKTSLSNLEGGSIDAE